VSIPKQTSLWDPKRNTSQVFPVTLQDVENARRALEAYKRDYPAHYQWIIDGPPNLTEAEHVQRFGEHYKGVRARKRA